MTGRLIFSLVCFSLACTAATFADEPVQEAAIAETASDGAVALDELDQAVTVIAKPPVAVEPTAPKKKHKPSSQRVKPHFAGVKRPADQSAARKRPSSRVKNEWVTSKTHPKVAQNEDEKSVERELSSAERPYFRRSDRPSVTTIENGTHGAAVAKASFDPDADGLLTQNGERFFVKSKPGSEKVAAEETYPQVGVDAPRGHVFLTGEWLYWRTRQGGMEFAIQGAVSSVAMSDGVASKIKFGMDSGFRVGGGVHLPLDGWDIQVKYTHFHPEATKHVDGSLFPLLLYQGLFATPIVTQARAHWDIELQVLDAGLGRAYYIGRSLSLRPNIGIKGAWIEQKARFEYAGGTIPAGQEYHIHTHHRFKAGGILAGVDSSWHLGVGFSFFGNVSAALLAGQFENSQKQTQQGVHPIDLKSDFNLLCPTTQLFAGLAWDRNFNSDHCHVGINIGFESQYFWRQNQLERFTNPTLPIYVRESEDLGFYGLTLGARVDF